MSGIAMITAVVSDLLTAYSSPVANSAAQISGMALAAVFRRRQEVARDILLDELRQGEKTIHAVAEVEELAAVTYRYARAAQEGAARLNLRLMAKVISGQAHLGSIVADDFLSYADLIAGLRREEVILLATLHRLKADPKLLEQLPQNVGRDVLVQQAARNQLVPTVFSNDETYAATELALTRTGLVIGGAAYGGAFYYTSPLMDRLSTLASFDAALNAEDIDVGANTGR